MSSMGDAVVELFASVSEAVARATWALLNADRELAEAVTSGDRVIDEQTAALEARLWDRIDTDPPGPGLMREVVALLLMLPELERSADLAEHIAQRALANVGTDMTPACRGIVQRMSEVTIEMWEAATDAFDTRRGQSLELHEADDELDILHERLTAEVASGAMSAVVAAQVTLIARFYERLGDHAVNLSRRVAALPADPGSDEQLR